jgi:hypothetical protein
LKAHKGFSPLWKHCQIEHNSEEVKFMMKITGKLKKAMPRQQNEGVRIEESPATVVLNSRAEWDQPPIIRVVPMRGNRLEDQVGAPEPQETRNNSNRGRARDTNRGRGGQRQGLVHGQTQETNRRQTRSQAVRDNIVI